MSHNLSFMSIFIRYVVGIHFVILAGLLQSMPVVVMAIGLLFTCISGWDPIIALVNWNARKKTESPVHDINKNRQDELKAVV